LTAGAAAACAICLSGFVITVGQKLDSADEAVLALPFGEKGKFRVIAAVKGTVAVDDTISAPGLPADSNAKPYLLLHNRLGDRWTNAGAIAAEHGGWLRELAATNSSSGDEPKRAAPLALQAPDNLTDAEWRRRVAIAQPYLENGDPLAAEIAYGEIARAPYGAMRSLEPQLEARRIAAWIDDPKLASRRTGYVLLLGIAGGHDEAADIEARIRRSWDSHDATDLSALLAADLELRGPARVGWLEEMYLAGRGRTLPEINAALLALSVHGGANGAIPRERVIEAYRSFIREHKPMAGFVAQDLADWEVWDAADEYVTILKSDAVKDPASELMIVRYIQRSPDISAREALQKFLDQAE
jgi:hypothetical protein